MELAEGRADRITLAYLGALAERDTRLLTVAALNGALQGRCDMSVNFVNAPLIAAERGIAVEEERRALTRGYTNLLRVTVHRNGEQIDVEGTTIGRDDRLWLAAALGYLIEIELAPLMAFFSYDDVPGVIGRVGTTFGRAGVNIANMAVSRSNHGDKALMALTIDTPAPPELLDEFLEAGFDDARFISL
jgi:D-3-phosphoglycerate dehydrogenase